MWLVRPAFDYFSLRPDEGLDFLVNTKDSTQSRLNEKEKPGPAPLEEPLHRTVTPKNLSFRFRTSFQAMSSSGSNLAAVAEATGAPLNIKERPVPTPVGTEVLVRNRAVAVSQEPDAVTKTRGTVH